MIIDMKCPICDLEFQFKDWNIDMCPNCGNSFEIHETYVKEEHKTYFRVEWAESLGGEKQE